jgi:hypothetical protein
VGEQPDVPVTVLERLHGRLTVDHGCDDVSVFSAGLLTDDHPVPVGDRRVDHRVTHDAEQEQ